MRLTKFEGLSYESTIEDRTTETLESITDLLWTASWGVEATPIGALTDETKFLVIGSIEIEDPKHKQVDISIRELNQKLK